jgi:hypothetical protein
MIVIGLLAETGDVAAGFAAADAVYEGTFAMPKIRPGAFFCRRKTTSAKTSPGLRSGLRRPFCPVGSKRPVSRGNLLR